MSSSSSDSSSRRGRKSKRRHHGRSRVKRLEQAVSKLTETVANLVNREKRSISRDQSGRKRSRSPSYSSEDSARIKAPMPKKTKVPSNGHDTVPLTEHFQPPSGTNNTEIDGDVLIIGSLDSETAALLGDMPLAGPPMGPVIHSELAARWNQIAKKGLSKEERDRFVAKFPRPENFEAIGTLVNAELGNVIPDPVKIRDEGLKRIQDHLAAAAGALGKVISGLLQSDSDFDKKALVADLSDTGRYLIGTQYSLSLFRRKQISTQIKDPAMSLILGKSEIYPKLFGTDLSSEVKAAKALDKVGQDITVQKTSNNHSSNRQKPISSYYRKDKEPLNSNRPFSSRKYKTYHQQKYQGNRNGQQHRPAKK